MQLEGARFAVGAGAGIVLGYAIGIVWLGIVIGVILGAAWERAAEKSKKA